MSMVIVRKRKAERVRAQAARREIFRMVDAMKEKQEAHAMDEVRPYTTGALEAASWVGVVLAVLVMGLLAATVLAALGAL